MESDQEHDQQDDLTGNSSSAWFHPDWFGDAFREHTDQALRQQLFDELCQEVMAPLSAAKLAFKTANQVCAHLRARADYVAMRMKSIASSRTIDHWMPLLRQMPKLGAFEALQVSMPHVISAVVAGSQCGLSESVKPLDATGGSPVQIVVGTEDLHDALRLAMLGILLSNIIQGHRFAGKGARISTDGTSPLLWYVPRSVQQAIDHYERRRDRELLLAREALPIDASLSEHGRAPLLTLAPLSQSTTIKASDGTVSEIWLLPYLLPFDRVQEALSLYAATLRIRFNIPLLDILDVLSAIAQGCLVWTRCLDVSEAADCIRLIDGSQGNARAFALLCRRGYVRFSRQKFIDQVDGQLHQLRTLSSREDRVKVISAFLAAFETPRNCDVVTLRPLPFVVTSPNDQVYVLLDYTVEFLEGLVREARRYQQTAHGDAFTGFVWDYVSQRCGAEVVLGREVVVREGRRSVARVDLLLRVGETAILVECKALSKSQDYWLGAPHALQRQRDDIIRAHKQLGRIASRAGEQIKHQYGTNSLVTAICLPEQAYLDPLDEFGMLTSEIPCVCTPNELVAYLTSLKVR